MKHSLRRKVATLAVTAAACVGALLAPLTARAGEADYQIFPTPQSVTYQEGAVGLSDTVTTVVESGIDDDAKARLAEALKLKSVSATSSDTIPTSGTAVLVGIHGSDGVVDRYVKELVAANKLTYDAGLFNQIDAHLVAFLPAGEGAANRIIVLGKDTDSAFYGLSTVYQILQQDADSSLRALVAADHADVITRGFIEGYYGNPWSTRDRVALMEWGGYYKLNAYFYAPKDDPKHNAQWRDKYTDKEIEDKIKPLAEAGNKSKVRFVYALHPFMHNAINASNYDETFPIMKEKFLQVIDAGVRQIAILADDQQNTTSPDLFKRLLDDTTVWLRELQKEKNTDGSLKYPGLKDTLIFCPVNYMGNGENWYRNLGENVQVINTGGRVWGKIDAAFANTFKRTSGVAPFMWINWPCSDNDKDALHMGGHNEFLGSDLTPGQVKGVVINPMQQSEPSKQGIFMTADFTWNLWTSTAHADRVWEKSFSYIDHNSGKETEGSNALRELSGHMKRMYGGGLTWVNGESADIQQQLADFRSKLTAGTVAAEDIAEMTKIFTNLQAVAKTYRDHAGTPAMLEQMEPWLNTWDDLTAATLNYLAALSADLDGDDSALIAKYAEAADQFKAANSHALWYVNHYEYARVGKAHIMPMVNALDAAVAEKATLAADPDAVVNKLHTNRTDTPVGSAANVFDGDPATGAEYRTPNKVAAGDYFGMVSSKPFDLTSVTFIQGGGKNFFDASKVQYLKDGQWTDLEGSQEYTTSKVAVSGLDIKGVEGVRLVAVRANRQDAWPTINEILVNKELQETGVFTGTVSIANQVSADNGKPIQNASDGRDNTEAWFKYKNEGEGRDNTVVDAAVQVTFDAPKTITSIVFKQGGDSTDVIESGKAYYQGTDDVWHEAGSITSAKSQTVQLSGPVSAKAIKVVNGAETGKWWRVVDLHAVFGEVEAPVSATTNMTQYKNNPIANAVDGNAGTKFWSNGNTAVNDYVMLNFGEKRFIDTVYFKQGDADKFNSSKLYYTTEATPTAGGAWHELATPTSAAEQTITFNRIEATGVKLVSTSATSSWFQLFEFKAFEKYAYAKDNIFATFNLDGVDLMARTPEGSFVTTDATVTLPKAGDVIAIDLGSIRRDVALSNADAQVATNAELVWSQNGIEWNALENGSVERAGYVGYRATADNATVEFNALAGSYLHSLSPSILSSNLPGAQTLDVAKVFDGDVTTATKSSGGPAAGSKVVFDLGQERAIRSLEYFVPETSKDFIRYAKIEVANSADAPDGEWRTVLDINSTGATADPGVQATAKEAPWLKHSSDFAGNVVIKSAEGLNETGRYLRINFTLPYTDRWVEIGELRINEGEYVPVYAGGDIETDAVEQRGKTPDNLLDRSLLTSWQPATNAAGKLTYHVYAPLQDGGVPYAGIRIVSGTAQPAVKVKAVVYTNALRSEIATKTVDLGTLDAVLKDFSFGKDATAVKDVILEWSEGTTPKVSDFFLLAQADPSMDQLLEQLRETLETAKGTDTSAWTTDSVTALKNAIDAAEQALAAPENLTTEQVTDLIAGLEGAMGSPILKYAGTELAELVNGAVTDGSQYTPESWKVYQDALDAARAGLENADNLSQAEGDRLAQELKDARAALVKNEGGSGQGGSGQGGTDQGGSTGKPGQGGTTGKPGTSGNLAQTGDMALFAIGAAAALGAGSVALGRTLRRRDK